MIINTLDISTFREVSPEEEMNITIGKSLKFNIVPDDKRSFEQLRIYCLIEKRNEFREACITAGIIFPFSNKGKEAEQIYLGFKEKYSNSL